ncbi:MAG: hypothetical protein IJE66_08235 [Akkermansia sp.]|nr:hypothetical protein [Akkermansia sp.]
MARKITIRRVGTIFPALCLVVVVFVSFCIGWLSIAGLPGWALRRIEQEAAAYGVQARIGAIRLALSSGLAFKAENTSLKMPFGEGAAEFYFRKLLVDFNIFEIAGGQKVPSDIQLIEATLSLPLQMEGGEKLEATQMNASLHFFNRGELIAINSHTLLQGIKLNFRGDFPLASGQANSGSGNAEEEGLSEAASIDLTELLTPYLPQLQQAYSEIRKQQWTDKNAPTIDLKLSFRNDKPEAEVSADIPCYSMGDILFRQASLNFQLENDSYIINNLSFRTENPYSEVTLRGGYDHTLRQLSFTAESNAALLQIAEAYYGKKFEGALSRIYPSTTIPPHISLRGNIDFSEDYALNSITLRGKVEQKNLNIGSSHIDHLLLSFFLSDGNFNIDKLVLKMNDGSVEASASSGNGLGQASLDLHLPVETLTQLASDIKGEHIRLPDGINLLGEVGLSAQASMEVNEFIPGKTRLPDLIPNLRSLSAQLKLDSLTINQCTLSQPCFSLNTDGIVQPSRENHQLSVGHISLVSDIGKVVSPGGAAVQDIHLEGDLGGLTIDDLRQAVHSLTIDEGELSAAIGSIRIDGGSMQGIRFALTDVAQYDTNKSWQQLLVGTQAELSIDEISQDDGLKVGKTQVRVLHQSEGAGIIETSTQLGEKRISSSVQLDYSDSEQNGWLRFNLARTEIPLGDLKPLLLPFTAELRDIEIPELIFLAAQGQVNINTGYLGATKVQLHLPELVRTPYTVPVNRGTRIPLNIDLNATVENNDIGELQYSADFRVGHSSGTFVGKADGNLSHYCHITGTNDIRVDIINQLIDDVDAHSIMRDFRFTDNSATHITDIDTMVQYDRGIKVDSFCKVRLLNTDFLIGALLDTYDSEGTAIGEKLRTDMGSNPYSRVHKATCDVRVNVQLDWRQEDGSPSPDNIGVTLLSPYLNYDNRPWLKRMGIKNGVKSSVIQGDSIVFDLNNNGIVLNNLKGLCYPAYAFGMYFAPLQQYMADVKLQQPAKVHTQRCEFPISRNSQVPISGLIKAEAPRGAAFHFIGTDIPLRQFSGFVNLSDDYVFLDKLNARTWEGVLNGAVKIGISGPHTTIDGQLTASNLNLRDIAAAYKTELSPALCNGNIRFRAASPELKDIQAYGDVSIRDGNLMQLGIFQPVGSLISDLPGYLIKLQSMVTGQSKEEIIKASEENNGFFNRVLKAIFHTTDSTVNSVDSSTQYIPFANHFMRYDIQQASAKFDISNGYLYTRDMRASGYNLDVDMKLRLNLDTLELRGNLWPRISSVPTIFISPITFLSDYLIDIVIYGPIDDIQWKFTLDRIMRGSRKKPSVTDASPAEQPKKG